MFTSFNKELLACSQKIHDTYGYYDGEQEPILSPIIYENAVNRNNAKYLNEHFTNYAFYGHKDQYDDKQTSDLENLIKDNKDYIDDVKDACARYHLDSDEAMLLLTLLKNHVAFDLHSEYLNSANIRQELIQALIANLSNSKPSQSNSFEAYTDLYKVGKGILDFCVADFVTSFPLLGNGDIFLCTFYLKKYLKSVENGAETISRLQGFMDRKKSIFETIAAVTESLDTHKLLECAGALKDIMSDISALFGFASIIFDVLSNLYRVEFNSYIFRNEDVQYI